MGWLRDMVRMRGLDDAEAAAVARERIAQNQMRVTVFASVLLALHAIYVVYYSALDVPDSRVEWRANLQAIHAIGCVVNVIVLAALRRRRWIGELWTCLYLAYG